MKRFVQVLVAICVGTAPVASMGYIHSDEEFAQIHKEQEEIQRALHSLSKGMSGELAKKFKILRKTLEVYATAHADNESNSLGTGWADARNAHEEAILKEFIDYFKKMESQQMKVYSEIDFNQKDGELNKLYQALQKNENLDKADAAAVSRRGIKNTQRVWLKYRDAWIAFAKIKYPKVSSHSLSTSLTADRISKLADFAIE